MKKAEKQCFKCKKWKKRSAFYRHRKMRDGLLGKCKQCAKKDATKYRNANLEHVQALDRDRGKLPHRQENSKIYRKRYPLRVAANNLLNYAVRIKRITKPSICSKCGIYGRIYGHHEDYCKPLCVVWLCQSCHRKRHINIKTF